MGMAKSARRPHILLMNSSVTTLERAFALARTGEYASVSQLKAQLKSEGYALNQLEGPSLMRQLRDLCTASRKPEEPVAQA